MYTRYFGIDESPFSIAPDPRYLYLSPGHEEALAHLLYGVRDGAGFVVLTGEVGTGKTTLCRCLLEQLPENVDVALADGRSLAGLLITEGLGREYDGGRREGWCDGE